MKQLIQKIGMMTRLSLELEKLIVENFHKIELPKKHYLLQEYEYARKLFFIEKGIVRTYYHHDDKEVTSWFYPENHFVTAWSSFYGQEASFEAIETLSDCCFYWIDYQTYQKLVVQQPAFGQFARILAEKQLTFIEHFSKGYAFMSAKEKYHLLLSYIPDIELRVKLSYIASFLGISQETLSRIRARR